ncbi:MAG: GGDEF domain-containing protein [Pseudohongiella sp.]|nr:GGDEF domain-containing protein [Pseudohongiella sp.]MDO9518703.1 GGDEF domain-containing protein [Pseudohongiella sp.]MDP2128015.1 GGDEF domain-containing protein [Pseudohongiella sp.]
MNVIDMTTLRLSILLTAIVCVLALLTVWRINRHLQGVLQMMLGVSFNLFAFLAGLGSSLGIVSAAMSIWLTNMFSLMALCVLTEGMLRFRGYESAHRWKLVFLLLPLAGLLTWWNLDNTVRRYMYHDGAAVVLLIAGALIMVWRTKNIHELRTYALASLFSFLMAIGFSARWVVAWQALSDANTDFSNANAFLYIGVLMYMVGLSFALIAACYLKSHQSVLQLASEDVLTGLPNRRSIDETLKRQFFVARRQQKPFAVMILDLNKFKHVNDTYGHAMGDALLAEVARRLRGFVREADYVGRLGGDEFLLILGDVTDEAGALAATARLRAHVDGPARLKGHSLSIEISQGLAIWPQDADSVDDLLRVADQRMYSDKPQIQAVVPQALSA